MLLFYDFRLALICLIFPPISYFIAEKMKYIVQSAGARFKEQAGRLSRMTLDRSENALTYRVFGCERSRSEAYEEDLTAYEHASVAANIWVSALPPLYQVICMISVIFILYFGSRNITGKGWCQWDIAAFTTFLSCYSRLSVKSSKAAKLFNSVHKAQVSWKRIRPFMKIIEVSPRIPSSFTESIYVNHLGFSYDHGTPIFSDVSFQASPGQIIGITGPVACGKSSLGKVFLCEAPYTGSVLIGNRELQSLSDGEHTAIFSYLGHDPELLNDTIEHNILLGDSGDCRKYLKAVCMEQEVDAMSDGIHTMVGDNGICLSGGQAKRLALARMLHFKRPVVILDDPFSALDPETEKKVFANIRTELKDSIILLISHRLYLFPEFDQIIWLENGSAVTADHETLLKESALYSALYHAQKGGNNDEA